MELQTRSSECDCRPGSTADEHATGVSKTSNGADHKDFERAENLLPGSKGKRPAYRQAPDVKNDKVES
jgi:hypothetical protein